MGVCADTAGVRGLSLHVALKLVLCMDVEMTRFSLQHD